MINSLLKQIPHVGYIVRFVISGTLTAIANISFLYILTEFFGVWYLTSSAIAFVMSMFISFSFQKWWTFKDMSTKKINIQFGAYVITTVCNLAVNSLLLYVLTDIVGIWYIGSQIITAGLIAIASFFIYRFIFRVSTSVQSIEGEAK